MGQVTPINQIVRTESHQTTLNRIFGLAQTVNGGLDFGQSSQTPSTYTGNMSGVWATAIAPGANVEFAVPHNLGRIPNGYLIFWSSVAAILYQGPTTGTAWTTSNIYVKSSVNAAQFGIFIT